MKKTLPKSASVDDCATRWQNIVEVAGVELPKQSPDTRLSESGSQPDQTPENSSGVDRPLPLWKRMIDLSLVLIGAPLWLPLFGFVALWVKFVSGGKLFFLQERVGHRGEHFVIHKFRSMNEGVETWSHESRLKELIKSDQPMTKLDSVGDPRLLPGARFLRAAGLDELPQILNVIRGEMSLVGPRPCTPSELNGYQCWQKRRFDVLPGITGAWQVNGKNRTTFSEMINMDISYAETMCPMRDLKILAQTVPAILKQVVESVAKSRGLRNGGALVSEECI